MMSQLPNKVMRLAMMLTALSSFAFSAELPPAANRSVDFVKDVQPLLEKNCYACHGPKKQKGNLRLDAKLSALRTGPEQVIVAGNSAASKLVIAVAAIDEDKAMPPDGDRLTAEQVGLIRAWIDQGAKWPDNVGVQLENKMDWWSLRPLKKPAVPAINPNDSKFVRTPIDAFIVSKLREKKLAPSQPADRRTLLRRVYLDLTGLPPTPDELNAFVADTAPDAYEKVVDRLLASPRYGERWARHWMDVVHFAETHGHDQDRIRPNAWPYRDYLIESFNSDKPYARFVQEQLAADVLFPDEPRLTPALGFIAAGPWDESSLRDIREDSICRQIGYYLDRDDMVMQTMSAFTSSTVHCARCHDHKFDPISQEDYYALQAVFAGIGRADRAYDTDPAIARQRKLLQAQLKALESKDAAKIEPLLSADLIAEIKTWSAQQRTPLTWANATVTSAKSANGTVLTAQPDNSFLASCVPTPDDDTYTFTISPVASGITGIRVELIPDESLPKNGPGRAENGNLHLSEVQIIARSANGSENRIPIARATADFNQKDWTIAHAIDGKIETAWGIYPETGKPHWAVIELGESVHEAQELRCVLEQKHGRKHVIGRLRLSVTTSPNPAGQSVPQNIAGLIDRNWEELSASQRCELAAYFLKPRIDKQLAALPPQQFVYAGAADFKADGTHRPVPTPRQVNLLRRGDIMKPANPAVPGAISSIKELPGRFQVSENDEGARRAALAQWLCDPKNPLTWRSIVNRLWHYHFGRGLAQMTNDFGRMGSVPTHPELLDWLAATLLENGGSLKRMHRLIVTSAVYMQSSEHNEANAMADGDNQYLWRMNRTRLDAESVRDSMLQISGRLNLKMGGPSVQHFSLSPGVHVTPVVDYQKYDWRSEESGRRSIYRFIFRTLPDPFMDALDCADASQVTGVRNVSVTPLQALAMMNNNFMVRHSEFLAERLKKSAPDIRSQLTLLYKLALLREPSATELQALENYANRFGLENTCRFVLNLNEFLFVD